MIEMKHGFILWCLKWRLDTLLHFICIWYLIKIDLPPWKDITHSKCTCMFRRNLISFVWDHSCYPHTTQIWAKSNWNDILQRWHVMINIRIFYASFVSQGKGNAYCFCYCHHQPKIFIIIILQMLLYIFAETEKFVIWRHIKSRFGNSVAIL